MCDIYDIKADFDFEMGGRVEQSSKAKCQQRERWMSNQQQQQKEKLFFFSKWKKEEELCTTVNSSDTVVSAIPNCTL